GFGYKWNMGWMNDSLRYMSHNPVHRQYHHDEMTFSLIYAVRENYILPLSHDEVVHGKGSLLSKMPGDDWQKFANLRSFYAYMWAHPGKKLLFMGGEFAQHDEWNHDRSLDWHLVEFAPHRGVQQLISTLNQLYRQQLALHQLDNCSEGFSWIDSANAEQSIFSFIRYAKNANSHVLIISNMTPNSYRNYRIGVPCSGSYQVLLNTDDSVYGGSSFSEQQLYTTKELHWQGFSQVIEIQLPPLSTLYLAPAKNSDVL
ncbi:MAG: alpha amylase C-terminal domain-containing protein, partial [Pseudomonadales bacterium]|nr:alpha amylase C-terminal domain-containing protein [Pseudomonadales bacterium]